ncbi:cytochrome c1-2, heme protein, mitochondrial [Selaginella moellendorffii]|uniref:cytochrome c1-2, heme protein, mitochondrial n=1 Tax=Selaginella moellendorffii TaxID=88036 RepID=UPI000D1C4AE8|nr:cytochrome c1-2, heme protein, mitochondrial [Selaginella moellendorffii]|eukprot:XP_002979392.2 cytochrome c1-2, heme protein, mitochondrial [Selaginella moellendorffii]
MAAARRSLFNRILGARATLLAQDGAAASKTAGVLAASSKLQDEERGHNLRNGLALLGAAATSVFAAAGYVYADEADHGLPPPSYKWPYNGFFEAQDHASIRRGHQVYAQVCAACHSMQYISYRHLIGVAYTEEEVKAMSAEIEVTDGPNDEGEMFTRPGRPNDFLPAPYPNEQAARAANGGAYPPDLSLMTKARFSGDDYVFSLLTGYREPPAGVKIRDGLHYNPYFPGGAIAMPQILMDGAVEYEDGTPATASQMAKDVVCFLAWAAEPEMDERKLSGSKWLFAIVLMFFGITYTKRWRFAPMKARRLVFDVVN